MLLLFCKSPSLALLGRIGNGAELSWAWKKAASTQSTPSETKPPRSHVHRSHAAPPWRSLTSLLGAEYFQHQASVIRKQIWHMKLNLVSVCGGEGAGMHVSTVHPQRPGEKPCHRPASLPSAPCPIPVSAPGETEQLVMVMQWLSPLRKWVNKNSDVFCVLFPFPDSEMEGFAHPGCQDGPALADLSQPS